MSFYQDKELQALGFQSVAKNVKISDKAVFYEPHLQSFGENSRIDDFVVVSGKVKIGRNVHVAIHSNIAGGEPGIEISDFAGLAYGCQIFAQSDDYSGETMTNPTVPDEFKNKLKALVHIGKHAILGTHTIVLPGVQIAEGCSFAARSLVLKNTEPWGFYAGNPVRRISDRSNSLLMLEAKYLAKFKEPRE